MPKYRVSDEGYSEVIEAEDMAAAEVAARQSWLDGDWSNGKCLVTVHIVEEDDEGNETGDRSQITLEVGEDPAPPDCAHEDGHDWQSPVKVVGGIKENPGVWSLGGTTIKTKTVCSHCGIYRVETAYGSQRNPGQCDQVEYLPADEASNEYADCID